MYKTEPYNKFYYKIFAGVYEDFRQNASKDYNFELEPLSYDNFVESINKGLLQCIVLLEDEIPIGFLVYTTLISEAIELNIIHCLGTENINQKRCLLLEKFLEINKHLMREKIVSYPMLGKQISFVQDIDDYGFKIINTTVMKFSLTDAESINRVNTMKLNELKREYSITNWDPIYLNKSIEVIHDAFKESSDVLFDSRFKTYDGCRDIIKKITENTYGTFLPSITKVLLYKKRPIGFCFANLTNDKIANIPIAAILKSHRGNGLSKIMLKSLIVDLLNFVITEGRLIKELNASCDADNSAAVCLYTAAGFKPDCTYPLAYHSGLI